MVIPDFNAVLEITLAVERIGPGTVAARFTRVINCTIEFAALAGATCIQDTVQVCVAELYRMVTVKSGDAIRVPRQDFEREQVAGVKSVDAMDVVGKRTRSRDHVVRPRGVVPLVVGCVPEILSVV